MKKLLSIQVGLPQIVEFRGAQVSTGIFKSVVSGPVHVGQFNLVGDRQADLSVHGGQDKAVYGYSFEAYHAWKMTRPDLSLEYGAFGENLTFDQIQEERIYIGDVFELGEAVLQVTQPRMPCFKLGIKMNDPSVIKLFMQVGRPGVYFRVLKEGKIEAGNGLKLIEQDQVLVSVTEVFNLLTTKRVSKERLLEMLQLKVLPDFWKKKIQSWV